MSNKKKKILKANLITFFTIFDGKPNMLVEYLLEYDILNNDLINFIINNKELIIMSKELKENGEIEKPYFTSIEEIQNFYIKFFIKGEDYIHPLLTEETKKEALISEFKKAIANEDYETCAKIRDYCILNKINIKF